MNIKNLTVKAYLSALNRIKQECVNLTNPATFLPFRKDKSIRVGNVIVAEDLLALGFANSVHQYLDVPDNIMYCTVLDTSKESLIRCREDERKRYVLLLNSQSEQSWWLEIDIISRKCLIVSYDEIDDFIRDEIDDELAVRALDSISKLRMFDE